MSKVFIIGLPRTGTTSISVAFLNLGFKVAHTAFTKQTFALADVVTDCPCFSDYKQLDKLFPGSQFIYLTRDLTAWLPSVQRLLQRMLPHLTLKTGQFSPVLKRSFDQTFQLSHPDLLTDEHLTACYQNHKTEVMDYFSGKSCFLSIDISKQNSYQILCDFLKISLDEKDSSSHVSSSPHDSSFPHVNSFPHVSSFPHVNKGAQVAHWKAVKHRNKISSFSAGKDHRQFFDYT